MESIDFHKKLRSAWSFLLDETTLARSVSSLRSLNVDADFNRVSLAPETIYREIYLTAISRSHYNIILADYSLFQYSWNDKDSWRLAFLPNPWIAGVPDADRLIRDWEALEEIGEIGANEIDQLIGELPYAASIPPIRFEFAAKSYREMTHPAAHLHIGRHTENRWPLSRVLNPLTFTMAIVKLYYADSWHQRSSFAGADRDHCVDLRLISELKSSPTVYLFSDAERSSIHLSSI